MSARAIVLRQMTSTLRAGIGILVGGLTLSLAGDALAANYVVYVHGRAQDDWDRSAVTPISGFTPAYVEYNATTATLAQANVDVRAQLGAYCTGANACIVVSYSNGGLQVGYTQAYYPEALANALYIEAGADASGGTELLNGFTSLAGQVFGATYPNGVDATLSVSAARNAYNHNLTAGLVTYHLGGNTDWHNGLWYVTAAFLPGDDDGVVSFASAFGCASSGKQTQSCAKYTGHQVDLDATAKKDKQSCSNGVCNQIDHFGMDNRAAYWAH